MLTAVVFGYQLLAPWLVIAYILFAVAMGTGLFVHQPWGIRLGKLLATTPDGPIPQSLATLLAERRERAAGLVDILLVVGFIFDMVVKPFS